jgi:hypothetical protein
MNVCLVSVAITMPYTKLNAKISFAFVYETTDKNAKRQKNKAS